jgi:hypothetical protein
MRNGLAFLISVLPKENYILELKYDDGLEGEYSCVELLKDKVFKSLADVNLFNTAAIDPVTNDIFWDAKMTLCSNALYKQLELKRLMKVFKIDLEKE